MVKTCIFCPPRSVASLEASCSEDCEFSISVGCIPDSRYDRELVHEELCNAIEAGEAAKIVGEQLAEGISRAKFYLSELIAYLNKD